MNQGAGAHLFGPKRLVVTVGFHHLLRGESALFSQLRGSIHLPPSARKEVHSTEVQARRHTSHKGRSPGQQAHPDSDQEGSAFLRLPEPRLCLVILSSASAVSARRPGSAWRPDTAHQGWKSVRPVRALQGGKSSDSLHLEVTCLQSEISFGNRFGRTRFPKVVDLRHVWVV